MTSPGDNQSVVKATSSSADQQVCWSTGVKLLSHRTGAALFCGY